MRILFIASSSPFNEQLKKAFQANGVEILHLDDRLNQLVPATLERNHIIWQLSRKINLFRRLNNQLFAKRLVEAAQKFKPDVLFVNKGLIIKPATLKTLSSLGIKTVNWCPENTQNEPYRSWLNNVAPHYDYFLSFDSAAVKKIKNQTRAHYVPFAVDPAAYDGGDISQSDRSRFESDICFIGAPYPERILLLSLLDNLNLKIFGWEGWKQTSLAAHYYGPLNAFESARAYRCAKICVNTNLEPPTAGVNVKTFEIPVAGGFQLSDYRTDIHGLFEVGKEIEVFRDKKEFQAKVTHYLSHDSERDAIARAGRERVLKEHTLDHRVGQMLEIIT